MMIYVLITIIGIILHEIVICRSTIRLDAATITTTYAMTMEYVDSICD
jgi:hypothetical protein